jgi:hypothetical protein
VISIALDSDGISQAASSFERTLDDYVRAGLEMTLESIAVRAKQTTTFVDRTGALRNSIQSDGVTGALNDGEGLIGTVSYAATSPKGAFYGSFLEYGTRFIKERRFIRDAIDAEDGAYLEDAVRAAFESAGFEVA